MQRYRAYVENGCVYPKVLPLKTKGRRRAIITVFDEPRNEKVDVAKRLADFDKLVEEIRLAADEPMPALEPVWIRREVES